MVGIVRRVFGLIFVLGIFIGAVFAQDASPTAPAGNVVIVESAFVRSGPGDSFVAVGALFAGDTVTPLNISEDAQWILIPYSRGNGWIQRNLVAWENEAALDLLPSMAANITPTPRVQFTNTPFIPTFTPDGNYINPNNAQSAYVRAGPGRTYLRLGQLRPGDVVTPVARNEDGSWIMIRFQLSPLREGFGWVAADLINWEDPDSLMDLPIVLEDNLTPTATFTASATASPTGTIAASNTPSATYTLIVTTEASATATTAPSETNTVTTEPSATNTDLPTETASATATTAPTETATNAATTAPSATNTATDSPTATNTDLPTETPSATNTATSAPSETPTITATDTPSATNTDLPTETPTNTATAEPSATNTDLPTETPTTEAAVVVVFPSETPTEAPSNTPEPSATASQTTAPTDIFSVQSTAVAVNSTEAPSPAPTDTPLIEETAPAGFSLPLEAIVGAIVLLLVAIYIGLYMQGLSAASRYKEGFVVDRCPVCQRGHLHVEERPNRLLGIPMTRRTVRCDVCRSVLRETGNRRWRYAVDRIENPVMFDRFNGKEVTDADLERLLKQPPKTASARTNPTFMDDEQGN